jgi:PAS domain S-box-containing protein
MQDRNIWQKAVYIAKPFYARLCKTTGMAPSLLAFCLLIFFVFPMIYSLFQLEWWVILLIHGAAFLFAVFFGPRYLKYKNDISRRYHDTQAEKENARRLQIISDGAHLGIWEWHLDKDSITLCSRCATFAGYTPAELDKLTFEKYLHMVHKEDREEFQKTVKDYLADQKNHLESVYRVHHKEGRWVWIQLKGQVINWQPNGHPLTVLGTQADITQSKLAEAELFKLSKITSQTNNVVIITDRNGITEWVNGAYTTITGYTAEESIGITPGKLLQGPDTDSETIKVMGESIKNQKPFHVQVLNYHKNGTPYWIDVRCNPIFGTNGELNGYIAFELDITDTHEARLLLKRQQALLESMSEQARIGTWEIDVADNAVSWSTMTRLIHAVPDNFEPNLELALGFFEPGTHQNNVRAAFEAAMRVGTPWSCEAKIINALGEDIWVRITGNAQWHKHKCVCLFGSYQDINNQKQVETELALAKELVESATNAKSEFLATMSHEIRTPMNGVLGMLHLLGKSELTEGQRQKLKPAQESAQSLLVLINDILDFSKVESGKLQIETIEIDLKKYLYQFVQSMALRAQEKGIELLLDETALQHNIISSDPVRLQQILSNLVSNAIKFTHEGHITIRVESSQHGPQAQLEVSVQDTGIGIDENKIPMLFHPFTQVDASTTREYGGTGLGLAICKKLCEIMGGSISAKSTLGLGSTFSFVITLVSAEPAEPWSLPEDKHENVLLMEPNVHAASLIEKILKNMGAYTLRHLPDLSYPQLPVLANFTTVILPIKNTYKNVIETLKKHVALENPTIKVVFLTAWDFEPKSFDTKDLERPHFITKPFYTENFQHVFREGPQKNTQTAEQPDTSATADRPIFSSQKHVLLVEDNLINQEVASMILEEFGLQITLANNGQEALDKLNQAVESGKNFDLILMDCQMPEMDGYETTAAIRQGRAMERYRMIPIVAMTANAMEGDEEKCLNAGMNDYLPKPIDPDRLQNMLTKWFEKQALIDISVQRGNSMLIDFEQEREKHGKGDLRQNAPSNTKPKATTSKRDISRTLRSNNTNLWRESEALESLIGKTELLLKLLAQFNKTLPRRLEVLDSAIKTSDFEQIKQSAHSLKSSAGQLRSPAVETKAQQIEQLAKKQDIQTIKTLAPQFIAYCHALNIKFQHYIEDCEND